MINTCINAASRDELLRGQIRSLEHVHGEVQSPSAPRHTPALGVATQVLSPSSLFALTNTSRASMRHGEGDSHVGHGSRREPLPENAACCAGPNAISLMNLVGWSW